MILKNEIDNSYLYHKMPINMAGKTLFPLNSMKKNLPQVYETEKAKYKGREFLMDEMVPILNCRWNDVLHLSPIEPKLIYSALFETGFKPDKTLFYKIPVSLIDRKNTVIFKYENEDAELTSDQIIPFQSNILDSIAKLPSGTKQWYQYCFSEKRQPLLFHLVPHVLTTQPIDITNCDIVSWRD